MYYFDIGRVDQEPYGIPGPSQTLPFQMFSQNLPVTNKLSDIEISDNHSGKKRKITIENNDRKGEAGPVRQNKKSKTKKVISETSG